jgi:hypothetical protein
VPPWLEGGREETLDAADIFALVFFPGLICSGTVEEAGVIYRRRRRIRGGAGRGIGIGRPGGVHAQRMMLTCGVAHVAGACSVL